MDSLAISHHACRRYVERVDPSVTPLQARRELRRLARCARSRATPRHWMRVCAPPDCGLRFLYPAELPGVCFLVREMTLVTVFTRDCARTWATPSRELRPDRLERRASHSHRRNERPRRGRSPLANGASGVSADWRIEWLST